MLQGVEGAGEEVRVMMLLPQKSEDGGMAVVWRAEEGARVVGPTIGEGRMGSRGASPCPPMTLAVTAGRAYFPLR